MHFKKVFLRSHWRMSDTSYKDGLKAYALSSILILSGEKAILDFWLLSWHWWVGVNSSLSAPKRPELLNRQWLFMPMLLLLLRWRWCYCKEYWMIYRGQCFLDVVWFGFWTHPLPLFSRKMSLLLRLHVCPLSSLLAGEEVGGGGGAKSYEGRRECLVLYKLFNTHVIILLLHCCT